MASDDAYLAFLNNANRDTSASAQTAALPGKATLKARDQDCEVPREISAACKDAVYVTDADEPFETVALRYSGDNGLPSEDEFAKLINHPAGEEADIQIMDPLDWDSKGRYTNVLEAVRQATSGNDVRVYRVPRDHTRVEYWLVSAEGGRLVGVKALGIES